MLDGKSIDALFSDLPPDCAIQPCQDTPVVAAPQELSPAAAAEKAPIPITDPQLQHAFKHAGDFGVEGNANKKTLAEFRTAIQNHVTSADTKEKKGIYRGNPATHFVDEKTGLNVICDSSGKFLSGWKLNPQQLEHVLTTGKLGGG